MDQAYVHKPVNDNNGVMYLLILQDVFDWTVDAKKGKQKIPKKQFLEFWPWLQEKIDGERLGWQGNIVCWRVRRTLQNWRNTKLLFNEWEQVCISWTYNTIPGNYTLPLHGRLWIQVHSQIVSFCHNPEFQKKIFDRLDAQECQEIRLFVHSVQQATKRSQKTQV